MKNVIETLTSFCLACLITSGALAVEPERCFISPLVRGLAWDGSSLWLSDEVSIYQIDPLNGNIKNWFPAPGDCVADLAYHGGHLWMVDCACSIKKINPETGVVVGTVNCPSSVLSASGLTASKDHLWLHGDEQTGPYSVLHKIYKIDPQTGMEVWSFPVEFYSVFFTGLAWDGKNLWWSVPYYGYNAFYEINPETGEILRIEEYADTGYGLTFDGQYLWNGSFAEPFKTCSFDLVSPTWSEAYTILFADSQTMETFRAYRDNILQSEAQGRLLVEMLYQASREALRVLFDNPELMTQAKSIIAKHESAVSDVVSGWPGTIHEAHDVLVFLDSYAEKAPPDLALLTAIIKREMERRLSTAKPFFGFDLR